MLTAAQSYPGFASSGNSITDSKEIAAFFANVAHETNFLYYVNEVNGGSYTACGTYPCAAGQSYFGRGPLQISWNYNYYMASTGQYWATGDYGFAAGQSGWATNVMVPTVGCDIFNNPNLVSTNGVCAWKTAFWFWSNHGKDWDPPKPTVHADFLNKGFGATIDDINGGLECSIANYPNGSSSPNTAEMQDRVNDYNFFLIELGVSDSRTKTC